MANISFDKIEEYTDIGRAKIKAATSILVILSLVYVEHIKSSISEHGIANAYRLTGLEPYWHMGTKGRAMEALDFEPV